MRKLLKSSLCLALLSTPHVLLASQEIPKFYWHNKEGLKSAAHCKVTHVEESRFRISSYFGDGKSLTENIRNYNSVQQSHLVNGSLVKITDGRTKKNYDSIEVIGVNQGLNVANTKWSSQRGDSGYLFSRSLQPVEDFIIKITGDVSSSDINLKNSYLRINGNGQYLSLSCPEFEKNRDYLIFTGHLDKSEQVIDFQIGVYWDETEIFKNIETINKTDAIEKKLIPAMETEELDDDAAVSDEEELTEEEILEHQEEILKEDDAKISEELSSQNNALPSDISQQAGLQQVVCISGNTLNVRNEGLDKVIFAARKGEQVKLFQDWEGSRKEGKVGNETHNFVKVQFSERESQDLQIGWVVDSFIAPKSQCEFIKETVTVSLPVDKSNLKIKGIDDPNCCEFPTVKKVTHSYTSGMRMFRANRGKGTRLHAACDLYRYKDEPIVAVAPGTVVRDRYFFYQGTYALEVVHTGGFIVRYGELTNKGVTGVSKGKSVKMGDRLGYIGVVNSGCCRPMLHFELYKGNKSGSLSQKGNKFQRRSDLMDPTPYLLKWEDKKF
jgi:murein DD-endopeptidase MepM/ murein hydrolase activator NlpD